MSNLLPQPEGFDEADYKGLAEFWRKYASTLEDVAVRTDDLQEICELLGCPPGIRRLDFLRAFAKKYAGAKPEFAGWAVYREGDKTFPRFFSAESGAIKMAFCVNEYPGCDIVSLYKEPRRD